MKKSFNLIKKILESWFLWVLFIIFLRIIIFLLLISSKNENIEKILINRMFLILNKNKNNKNIRKLILKNITYIILVNNNIKFSKYILKNIEKLKKEKDILFLKYFLLFKTEKNFSKYFLYFKKMNIPRYVIDYIKKTSILKRKIIYCSKYILLNNNKFSLKLILQSIKLIGELGNKKEDILILLSYLEKVKKEIIMEYILIYLNKLIKKRKIFKKN